MDQQTAADVRTLMAKLLGPEHPTDAETEAAWRRLYDVLPPLYVDWREYGQMRGGRLVHDALVPPEKPWDDLDAQGRKWWQREFHRLLAAGFRPPPDDVTTTTCDRIGCGPAHGGECPPRVPGATGDTGRTRYFLDTEFMEDGHTIELLSIGVVCDDGREFYAESTDADWSHANDWVKANVLGWLNPAEEGHPRSVIAERLIEFVAAGQHPPEFWAYYADYDWVALCQLFGTMLDLPDGWPMFCMDLKQEAVRLGDPSLPEQSSTEHYALADARWNAEVHAFLAAAGGVGDGTTEDVVQFAHGDEPISDYEHEVLTNMGIAGGASSTVTDRTAPVAPDGGVPALGPCMGEVGFCGDDGGVAIVWWKAPTSGAWYMYCDECIRGILDCYHPLAVSGDERSATDEPGGE